jgi:hypothetical protein
VIAPKASAAFVAAMEDILAVYKRPRDEAFPLVCLDETSKQLIKEKRAPIPMTKGHARRSPRRARLSRPERCRPIITSSSPRRPNTGN